MSCSSKKQRTWLASKHLLQAGLLDTCLMLERPHPDFHTDPLAARLQPQPDPGSLAVCRWACSRLCVGSVGTEHRFCIPAA